MKINSNLLFLTAVTLCSALSDITAAEKHDHKHLATPKGGRLLEKTEPHAEFVLEKDHTATINFYTHDMKPVSAGDQMVTLIADAKNGKQTIPFEKKGDSLVSKTKLPEGDGYNVVVQFKQKADARPQNFRFKLDTHICSECKRAEYGCVCGH